jgi:hypothetical protein
MHLPRFCSQFQCWCYFDWNITYATIKYSNIDAIYTNCKCYRIQIELGKKSNNLFEGVAKLKAEIDVDISLITINYLAVTSTFIFVFPNALTMK